jgi:hypothetical protein
MGAEPLVIRSDAGSADPARVRLLILAFVFSPGEAERAWVLSRRARPAASRILDRDLLDNKRLAAIVHSDNLELLLTAREVDAPPERESCPVRAIGHNGNERTDGDDAEAQDAQNAGDSVGDDHVLGHPTAVRCAAGSP